MDTTVERTVPYVDIAGSGVPLHDELKGAFARVLHCGQFVLGAEVDEFEARFAELCGTKFAVGVNSGTDAMILALRALDIGSGDEVITAPNSFIATAAAIVHVGARPVFVDCPSSKQMGLLSVFHKGGSGSSLFDVKPLGFDGSSGGFGWSVF